MRIFRKFLGTMKNNLSSSYTRELDSFFEEASGTFKKAFGATGKEVSVMLKRTLEKSKKAKKYGGYWGDPWYEYRKRKILPEKFEYGMNCLLDRWAEQCGEEVVQKAYEELKKDPNSYELDEYPKGYDVGKIPVLFAVIGLGIEAFNRAAKILNLEREQLWADDIFFELLKEKHALGEEECNIWIVTMWHTKQILGEEKYRQWLLEEKGNLHAPMVIEATHKYYEEKFSGGKIEPTVKPQITTFQDTIDEYTLKEYIRGAISALGDENEAVRLHAKASLFKVGEPAVGSLIPLLGDKKQEVWVGAAGILVNIGEPAVGSLITALGDEDEKVREIAEIILKKITGKDFSEDSKGWQKWWEQNKDKFPKSS